MKILMLGWEFPPHIAGGLGVACYGLTKGLREVGGIDLTFVVPTLYGDEDTRFLDLVGVRSATDTRSVPAPSAGMEYVGVFSYLQPYMSESAFQAANEDRPRRPGAAGRGAPAGGLFDEVLAYASRVRCRLAEAGEFDLIHAHDWMTFPAAIAAQALLETPLIVHIHSTECDRSGANIDQRIFDIERRGMDAADRIIVVSNLTRDVIIERYGQERAKIHTIYNAMEPYAPAPAPCIRAKDPALITFVGRVTYQKGPEYFIEAAHLVLQKNANVRFVLAGDGDLLPFVKDLALSLGIAGYIDFPGFLKADQVRQLHERSSVYVMPSVSEPFGIAALEAVSMNVPVIISNRSGAAEVLEHMIEVDPWDVEAIADAILRLLADETYASTLCVNAKRELEQLSWRGSAEQLKKLYTETLTVSNLVDLIENT